MPGIQVKCQMVFTLLLQMPGNQMVFRWQLTLESAYAPSISDGLWKKKYTGLILSNLDPCYDNSTITACYSDAHATAAAKSLIMHVQLGLTVQTQYYLCGLFFKATYQQMPCHSSQPDA